MDGGGDGGGVVRVLVDGDALDGGDEVVVMVVMVVDGDALDGGDEVVVVVMVGLCWYWELKLWMEMSMIQNGRRIEIN